MLGPWKDDAEVIECMMYWQKRALEAERDLEEVLDDNEDLVELVLEARGNADYWHQQFLDKDKEIRAALEIVHQQYMIARKELQKSKLPEEESDDPWKYRS